MTNPKMTEPTPGTRHVRTWDLPVRVFHWALVLLVISQIVTVSIGGNAMDYHVLGGYAILTLVVFRIVWGFWGTRNARFANFLATPRAALRYAKSLLSTTPERAVGHNPLGGWSVLAMLMSILVQAASGLFADDDIMTTGPLWKYVSDDTADIFNAIHETNAVVLLTLICIHLGAILFHLLRKRENLVKPMFTGRKLLTSDATDSFRPSEGTLRALIILAVCAAATWTIVTF